jgi:SAM-dependent methyltransferase
MRRLFRRLFRRETRSGRAEDAHFVELVYQYLLQRPADHAGKDAYLERLAGGHISHTGVLREIAASEEYRRLHSHDPAANSEELVRYRAQCDAALERALVEEEVIPPAQFDAVWAERFGGERELIEGQREFVAQHRQRFGELFNGVAQLVQGREQVRLLEFGVSEYSAFYRRFWPQLQLELADRPTSDDYPGFNAQRSLEVSGAQAFHAVDLNQPRLLLGEPWQHLRERFDVVVFTEVLEHLRVNPVDLLEQLLALLAPAGLLYLTTPNFLRRESLERIAVADNPQEVYPAGEDNWDAHHHFREFTAREMLAFIERAGGSCRAFHYSDCWDTPAYPARSIAEQGNLVFVIGRAIAPA